MAQLYSNPMFATGLSDMFSSWLGGSPQEVAAAEYAAARAANENDTRMYRQRIGEAGSIGDMLIASLQAGGDFSGNAPTIASSLASLPGSGYTPEQQGQIAVGTGTQRAQDTFTGLGQVLANDLSVQGLRNQGALDVTNAEIAGENERAANAYRVYQSALGDALIGSESGGDFNAENSAVGAGGHVGHFGRGQFGVARLEDAKRAGILPSYVTPDMFAADTPDARMWQQATEAWHRDDILTQARNNGVLGMVGQSIMGIPITEQGIINVAHLGGSAGAERFFKTGGQYNPADANGTRLSDYLALGAQEGGAPAQAAPQQDAYELLLAAGVPGANTAQTGVLKGLAETLLDPMTPDAGEPFTLGNNQIRFDAAGNEIARGPVSAAAGETPTLRTLSSGGRTMLLKALDEMNMEGLTPDQALGLATAAEQIMQADPNITETAAIEYVLGNIDVQETTTDSWMPFDEETTRRFSVKPRQAGAGIGQASGGLAVGTIEDGYEFLGGDPADPNSWRKV